jgi:hypothetical protein
MARHDKININNPTPGVTQTGSGPLLAQIRSCACQQAQAVTTAPVVDRLRAEVGAVRLASSLRHSMNEGLVSSPPVLVRDGACLREGVARRQDAGGTRSGGGG